MSNLVAKIGTITFKNFSENVVINQNFNVSDLIKIIENDRDFVKFEVFDPTTDSLLYSTVVGTKRVTYNNGVEDVTEGGVLVRNGEKRYVLTNHLGWETDLTHDDISAAVDTTLEFYALHREFTQTGRTYDAYAKNPLKLHGKVEWFAKPLLRDRNGYQHTTKKEAVAHVNALNRKAVHIIENLKI